MNKQTFVIVAAALVAASASAAARPLPSQAKERVHTESTAPKGSAYSGFRNSYNSYELPQDKAPTRPGSQAYDEFYHLHSPTDDGD